MEGNRNVLTRDSQFACATAPKRDSRHWKNGVVTWGELLDWMATPDEVKEAGNYVMGTLRPTPVQHNPEDPTCQRLHRNKGAIVTRSMLTLDLDTPRDGLPEALELVLGHAALLHTTYSSTPDSPRYRLIIPLDREVAPDEYVVAAAAVMQLVGEDNFDPGSLQPERYMFRPAAPDPATFQWWAYDGEPAAADALLEDFDEDLSGTALPKGTATRKRDPFTLEGVVGAFNRAYEDFQVLIEEYDLPYTPAGSNRWHLVGSRAVAGMGIVTDGLVYSHHANDPAYGQACTAFDLVRLHRFGTLDEEVNPQTPINKLPSFEAMLDLAGVDARVTAELVGADFAADLEDEANANDWKLGLRRNRTGTKMLDEVGNWKLIRENDPVFLDLHYNEMTFATEVTKDLPWRPLWPAGPVFRNSDRQSLQMYLEDVYACRPARSIVDWMIDETAMHRYLNPVREWLRTLEWDGTPRVETCLPGVRHTAYTRLVARKTMVSAVARMMEPGCKWDHTLILHGKEGLGKTWWIERMSRGWTAPIGRLDSKDTLIALQRCWIATSDEGATMRKADAEALKEFLTRREDVFRMPYEREAQAHPRHCVIWGTTNDDVFLRNQEGNRRFLIVKVEHSVDFAALTDYYVEQVWAEAMHLYREGEVLLFLNPSESAMAAAERESFIEEGDGLEGIIHEYLSTPVPMDWKARSPEARQQWLQDRADGFQPEGDILQDEVCTIQIWAEALGQPIGKQNRLDLLNIGKALRALGWLPSQGRRHVAGYGPQVVHHRPAHDPVTDLEDLL